MKEITYDVRVYKTEVYKGTRIRSYTVRWKVGTKPWKEVFRNKAQADAYRSELLAAARRGEAFSVTSGRPAAWERVEGGMTWYEFARAYVDMKWKAASAKYRADIARALTAATPAMLATDRGKPADVDIRFALNRWGFNTRKRAAAPADVVRVLDWLSRNTKPVSALSDLKTLRHVLDTATERLDGRRVAASTARRHRAILNNALEFAVERRQLAANPLKDLKWKTPKASRAVDRRSVINPSQARALLNAVKEQKPSGPMLVAFFGLMYYSGLRPEEAVNVRLRDVTLPALVRNPETGVMEESEDAWGELHLGTVAPEVPRDWTDDGSQREERASLKHRAEGDTRTVPCPPELTVILRAHIHEFGVGEDGRLFRGLRAEELPPVTVRRVWDKARKAAFKEAEYRSPLAKRPYDLRHACLSTWLNGGVAPTLVAEWAGHSLAVLQSIYAKTVVGQDAYAKKRITEALQR